MNFEKITKERIEEPLLKQTVTKTGSVKLAYGSIEEDWDVWHVKGKTPPYGVLDAGKIIIGPVDAPLAGLAYAKEHGRLYIHQAWVDPEFRGKGVGKMLVKIYAVNVTPKVVFSGPFSPSGLALAKAVKAKIINGT